MLAIEIHGTNGPERHKGATDRVRVYVVQLALQLRARPSLGMRPAFEAKKDDAFGARKGRPGILSGASGVPPGVAARGQLALPPGPID